MQKNLMLLPPDLLKKFIRLGSGVCRVKVNVATTFMGCARWKDLNGLPLDSNV